MLLKKFDFLSPSITLYYFDQKRHSSYIGGLLTILMVIFSFFIIIQYSFIKVYPSESSLLIFRNYDKVVNLFFNQTGLFHYIWIVNENNILDNNKYNNLIQLNNLKKGILRIYMANTYDNYEYNSSNLKNKDHWVYDTCSNYIDEDDLQYDISFSSCIKYYYNSNDKKYYSINDDTNFRWPYINQNISNFENVYFGIFVERCQNNTILNEILGDCHPEDKIDEYLHNFNNIFLSFINKQIQTNNKNTPFKYNSHKIYDNLSKNKFYFFIHDLTFIYFNYKESNFLKNNIIDYNSFMLDEDKTNRIYNMNKNKLLIAYILHSKKYINEFTRRNNNDILEFISDVGGSIYIIYILFYGFNFILNEKIIIRNFQKFLNNGDNDLIHRHINYERNKAYSFKTNYSHDLMIKNDRYNSLKSSYLGKNDLTNLTNNFINEANKKTHNNNYTIKISKINEEKERNKADNIIVINNNSFINENIHNKYISKKSLNKYNSLKIDKKRYDDKFEDLRGYQKTYTLNKSSNESPSITKIKTIIKNNDLNFVKVNKKSDKFLNCENFSPKRLENSDVNSKHKIVDTSSVSLLNATNQNKVNNLILNKFIKESEIKDTINSNVEKAVELNTFTKLNSKFRYSNKILPRQKGSAKLINNSINMINNIYENKNDKKGNKFLNSNLGSNIKRKSCQEMNNIKKEKEVSLHKNRNKSKKGGSFLKLHENKEEKHLSLFSKRSGNNSNISIIPERNNENNFQQIEKNVIVHHHHKKTFPNNGLDKRRKARQSFELETKSLKRNKMSSNKHLINQNDNEFAKTIKISQLSLKILCNYIFICKSRGNNIYIIDNFRKKLLSEEYLYILHINMFIFKQKFGCKSNLEQVYLLEELYNDF